MLPSLRTVVAPVRAASARLLKRLVAAAGPSADLVEAFVVRGSRALARIAERMPRQRLVEAVGAESGTDLLFRSIQDAAAIGAEIIPDKPDPLTAAFLRGAEMKRALLKAEGGVLSAPHLAEHLGITPQGLSAQTTRFWIIFRSTVASLLIKAWHVIS